MKRKRNILVLFSMIILSLLIFTACAAKAPAAATAQVPAATGQQEQPQEAAQVPETPVTPEAAVQPGQPAAAAVQAPVQPVVEQPETASQNNALTPTAASGEDKTTLRIEGSGVEKPVSLSLEEIESLEDAIVEDDYFALNSYGTKAYFHFKGIKLSALLDKAGLKDSAERITVMASDGYKLELTKEQALKEDYIDEQDPVKKYPVIIAWSENGQDYDISKGYPFRLVMGQKEAGDVNKPNWVMNIAVITID